MDVMIFRAIFICGFLQTSHAYFLFQSKYPAVEPVIKACRATYPDEKHMCGQMLRCIIDNVFSDYPARWTAGASILALVPTIVGLMSNSIDEIAAVAEESIFLAISISLSSVTVFSSRLGDPMTTAKPSYHSIQSEYVQTARDHILDLLKHNKQKHSKGWRNTQVQDAVIGTVMVGTSALIYWQLYEVTRYGIVTFACPVKVNVFLWALLGQILTLVNVGLRGSSFTYKKVYFKNKSRAPRPLDAPFSNPAEIDSHIDNVVIVLRCSRSGWRRRALKFSTAVFSFTFYTYGTVVLASMTLFEAADALRVVVVVAINAGFGRVVAYWTLSSLRKGKKSILVDVSAAHIDRLFNMIREDEELHDLFEYQG